MHRDHQLSLVHPSSIEPPPLQQSYTSKGPVPHWKGALVTELRNIVSQGTQSEARYILSHIGYMRLINFFQSPFTSGIII
jgi:hypothetical protein